MGVPVFLIVFLALFSLQESEPEPVCPGLNYPAVMSLYDPDLGGPNCDGDCKTVATGPLEDWMYEVAGACPAPLLGSTVHFPGIEFSMQCVDRGTAIKAAWSERDRQCVVYFDALWHLPDEDKDGRVDRDEDGSVLGVPYWFYWMVEDWTITFASGYHNQPDTFGIEETSMIKAQLALESDLGDFGDSDSGIGPVLVDANPSDGEAIDNSIVKAQGFGRSVFNYFDTVGNISPPTILKGKVESDAKSAVIIFPLCQVSSIFYMPAGYFLISPPTFC